ncbi:nuclear transport factor 2 family protein [Saccharopolyspora pogona]|uniref:nuclear transport factor 2 family protein n=1 Tax=Saccharopolyspora pogona TaxID=333966 RepID=UPI00168457D7|nr:nuclear transport factor 2 family protein [Saccharopolyspora pogona]
MVDLTRERPSASEVSDRIALRELVDSYAYVLDNRLQKKFGTLFCAEGRLVVPHPAGGDRPKLVFDGGDGWARAFALLAPFTATVHFVGNHLVSIGGDDATGETYCLAHELYDHDGVGRMIVRCVRYTDTYLRVAGKWFFHTRELTIAWISDQALIPPPSVLVRRG